MMVKIIEKTTWYKETELRERIITVQIRLRGKLEDIRKVIRRLENAGLIVRINPNFYHDRPYNYGRVYGTLKLKS